MGLLAWIIIGALAGWLASIVTGRNERQGCIMNIVVGVVGALLGGFLVQLLTGVGFDFGFNLRSFLVAVLGSVVLLLLIGLVRR
mgnify:CR=1 FL=1